jgi:hypothetical protein
MKGTTLLPGLGLAVRGVIPGTAMFAVSSMVFRSIIEKTAIRRISLGVVLVIIVVVLMIGVMIIGGIPLSQSSQSTLPSGAEPGRGRVELTP